MTISIAPIESIDLSQFEDIEVTCEAYSPPCDLVAEWRVVFSERPCTCVPDVLLLCTPHKYFCTSEDHLSTSRRCRICHRPMPGFRPVSVEPIK